VEQTINTDLEARANAVADLVIRGTARAATRTARAERTERARDM
jgi:hypothetical protein